jgi:cytochrome c553
MNSSRFTGLSTTVSFVRSHPWAIGLLVLLLALSLTGCGGGAATESNPVPPPVNGPTYNGPPPATADVQAFRIALWENIKATNRCGQCHGAGGQVPMFARTDDVNLAYEAANTVVDLTQPSDSRMVVKVGGGHNCWLSANSACADILTTWITNWAGAAAGGGTVIQLVPPPLRDVGQSRNFPDTPPASFTGVHNLLTAFCSRCHTSSAITPQSPYFASADINEAYAASSTTAGRFPRAARPTARAARTSCSSASRT